MSQRQFEKLECIVHCNIKEILRISGHYTFIQDGLICVDDLDTDSQRKVQIQKREDANKCVNVLHY